MNSFAAEIMKWLDEKNKDCVESTMKLIKEDAPKNKFSIVTGKMLMIEEVKTKIEQLEKIQGPV